MNYPVRRAGLEIHANAWLQPGAGILMGDCLYVRHMSEALAWMRGATVHYTRERCPTWSDATECRCMVDT